jgi:hypothetical protein
MENEESNCENDDFENRKKIPTHKNEKFEKTVTIEKKRKKEADDLNVTKLLIQSDAEDHEMKRKKKKKKKKSNNE